VREWRRRYRVEHHANRQRAHTIRRLKRLLAHDTSVSEAIGLAATAYGVDEGTLRRKAWCESHYYPGARNPSGASGLYQFLPSTFSSTPYRRFSIWSPYANALAAGWMHAHGRGGEWVCQ
jgi:soluble lytic murein transglycosylase-like protein